MKYKALTEKEAAKMLGLSPRTLQKYRQECGPPKYIKIGRAVRYLPEDLKQFLKDNRVTPVYEKEWKE